MNGKTPPQVENLDLVCPLTLDIFSDPVTAEDGKNYERASIQQWFQSKQPTESPLTRVAMGTVLKPNNGLRKRAQQWREAHGGAAHDTPRLQILNSSIVESLDSVWEEISQLNLNPPTIFATGNESAGKSTLLEVITGFPILPRDARLCTRAAIRVQLRRGATQLAKVSLWTRGASSSEIPGSCEHCALETLCIMLKAKMDEAVRQSQTPILMDKEIRVSIQVPYCPSLNFIDLPGFVTTDTTNQNLPALTKQLAEQVIAEEKDSAIFLLVVEATMPPNQFIATQVLYNAGVFERTIGRVHQGGQGFRRHRA